MTRVRPPARRASFFLRRLLRNPHQRFPPECRFAQLRIGTCRLSLGPQPWIAHVGLTSPQLFHRCSFWDSIDTVKVVGFLPEVNYMFSCSGCGEKVPFQSALLNQDLTANTVGFCSAVCQDAWYQATFSADTPSRKPSPSSATSAICLRATA